MQNFRVQTLEELMPGVGYNPFVEVAPPGLLYGVIAGVNSVRVKASIQYRGPALDDYFYAAIGNRLVVFDEYWNASSYVHFDATSTWTTYNMEVTIPITVIAHLPWTPGWMDLYVKIGTGLTPRKMGPEYSNVIEVLLQGDFQQFTIVSYEKV